MLGNVRQLARRTLASDVELPSATFDAHGHLPRIAFLCVDDEASGLKLRQLILENTGYMVSTAGTVSEALTLFRTKDFDLVVTDHLLGRAADPANLRKNATTIQQMFEKRGVKSHLLEIPGVPPAVYGEIMTPGATRTIMLYAHHDGQPVDPKEWVNPPFDPTLRDAPLDKGGKAIPLPAQGQPFGPEWRIYARGSGDDKVNVMLFMAAIDALRANKIPIKSNIKFIVEGEEEAGSPHLADYMRQNKDLLSADVWLICDGPMDQSRRQNILFGVRGVQIVDVTVYGARRELHSGHYGNWAPNPAMMLAQLLASMKDENGRVLIDHFYDGVQPFGEIEKKAIAEAPKNDEQLKRDLWLGRTDGNGASLLELYALPSLNIRGMVASRMGAQASNVIPATASATIDMRLVRGIDKQAQVQRFIEHIRKQGYFVVDKDPDEQARLTHPKVAKVVVDKGGYNAAGSSMDLPSVSWLSRLLRAPAGR